METQIAHWTEQSPKKFAYRIASDFVEQIRRVMKKEHWSQRKLAKKLKVSPGRISQVLNNPGNLQMETMIEWARALGLKVSVLLYNDGDKENRRGPINAEVFRLCWEHADQPADMWAIQEKMISANTLSKESIAEHVAFSVRVALARGIGTDDMPPFLDTPISIDKNADTHARKGDASSITPLREVQHARR